MHMISKSVKNATTIRFTIYPAMMLLRIPYKDYKMAKSENACRLAAKLIESLIDFAIR